MARSILKVAVVLLLIALIWKLLSGRDDVEELEA